MGVSETYPIAVELGKVALSPILAAMTAIWVFRRQQREQVHCFVGWDMFQSGPEAEIPYLAVQNRSDRTVMIKAFTYRSGLMRKAILHKVAIYWEDPTDLRFPMAVKAGETRKFRMDPKEAAQLADKTGKLAGLLHRWFGLPRLSVQIQTMAGANASTSLEPITI